MATVSNSYNEPALCDWVSETSDTHEGEILSYKEEDDRIELASTTYSEGEQDGDLFEFDGTSANTEYFLDAAAMEHLSYSGEVDHDDDEDPELQQYFSGLAAISSFDFSSIHVPSSNKSPLACQWSDLPQDLGLSETGSPMVASLLSCREAGETLQVMSDSIHHAQDGNTLLGVPEDTPLFSGFPLSPTEEVSLHGTALHSEDILEMLSERSNSQSELTSVSSYSEHSEVPSDDSSDQAERVNVCLKTLHSQPQTQQHEDASNSPTKHQSAAKKARALKQLKANQSSKDFSTVSTTQIKQRKRKRTLVENELAFPQDAAFSSDDSDEDQIQEPKLKRRCISKLKHVVGKHTLTPPNFVHKQYLIALNDPRFTPQLYDPQLRVNFFANEQILRVIESESDTDVEII